MADSSSRATTLIGWIDRIRAGDPTARDELVRAFQPCLTDLARRMLRRNSRLGQWVEVEDVLQGALMRILRALEYVHPDSTRAFLGLAAEQMRRELLDLGRHYYGPHGDGANQVRVDASPVEGHPRFEPPDQGDTDDDLELWYLFHQEVEKLPIVEREVVGLMYYHGWTQSQGAAQFGVNVRTVRRWWESARSKLHGVLGRLGRWVKDGHPVEGRIDRHPYRILRVPSDEIGPIVPSSSGHLRFEVSGRRMLPRMRTSRCG